MYVPQYLTYYTSSHIFYVEYVSTNYTVMTHWAYCTGAQLRTITVKILECCNQDNKIYGPILYTHQKSFLFFKKCTLWLCIFF